MKLHNTTQVNEFLAAVNASKGSVWLESNEGDHLNLKSKVSQCVAMEKLLGEHGDSLELFCSNPADEQLFFGFFAKNPNVL